MLSQDMEAVSCHFRQEQALLSALPIVSLEKKLFERSKRNILTGVEKSIFIDETWPLIGASSNRLAAEFVLEIFKIIRGYGGAAITATQNLNASL